MNWEQRRIEEAKNGDLSALNDVVTKYYLEIYKYCFWQTKNKEEAEDITQETFYKAFRFINAYKNNGSFRAFLYKIAHNICIDYQRKAGNTYDGELFEVIYEDPGYKETEAFMNFEEMLVSLNDKQRELVILRFGEDLSFREIAEITGSKLRTVQTEIRRALKKIEKDWRKNNR